MWTVWSPPGVPNKRHQLYPTRHQSDTRACMQAHACIRQAKCQTGLPPYPTRLAKHLQAARGVCVHVQGACASGWHASSHTSQPPHACALLEAACRGTRVFAPPGHARLLLQATRVCSSRPHMFATPGHAAGMGGQPAKCTRMAGLRSRHVPDLLVVAHPCARLCAEACICMRTCACRSPSPMAPTQPAYSSRSPACRAQATRQSESQLWGTWRKHLCAGRAAWPVPSIKQSMIAPLARWGTCGHPCVHLWLCKCVCVLASVRARAHAGVRVVRATCLPSGQRLLHACRQAHTYKRALALHVHALIPSCTAACALGPIQGQPAACVLACSHTLPPPNSSMQG